jgi:hypothetical protein
MRSRGDEQASRTVADGVATTAAYMKELLSVIPPKDVAKVFACCRVQTAWGLCVSSLVRGRFSPNPTRLE